MLVIKEVASPTQSPTHDAMSQGPQSMRDILTQPVEINEGGSVSRSPVATSRQWFIVLCLRAVRKRQLPPVDRDSRSASKRSGKVRHGHAERIAR
jgi:hypothetical protein